MVGRGNGGFNLGGKKLGFSPQRGEFGGEDLGGRIFAGKGFFRKGEQVAQRGQLKGRFLGALKGVFGKGFSPLFRLLGVRLWALFFRERGRSGALPPLFWGGSKRAKKRGFSLETRGVLGASEPPFFGSLWTNKF